jgi:hypothetical protein
MWAKLLRLQLTRTSAAVCVEGGRGTAVVPIAPQPGLAPGCVLRRGSLLLVVPVVPLCILMCPRCCLAAQEPHHPFILGAGVGWELPAGGGCVSKDPQGGRTRTCWPAGPSLAYISTLFLLCRFLKLLSPFCLKAGAVVPIRLSKCFTTPPRFQHKQMQSSAPQPPVPASQGTHAAKPPHRGGQQTAAGKSKRRRDGAVPAAAPSCKPNKKSLALIRPKR